MTLQARRQISALLKEGKASTQQGQGQHALELLKQVLSDVPWLTRLLKFLMLFAVCENVMLCMLTMQKTCNASFHLLAFAEITGDAVDSTSLQCVFRFLLAFQQTCQLPLYLLDKSLMCFMSTSHGLYTCPHTADCSIKQGESSGSTQVCDAPACWAMQAGQLSQELRDKRAERAVARATANAYRQVYNRVRLCLCACNLLSPDAGAMLGKG